MKKNREEIVIEENGIVVKINRTYYEGISMEKLYKATKAAWKIADKNIPRIDYVFSSYDNTVVGIFKPLEWFKISDSSHPDYKEPQDIGRNAFNGIPAEDEIWEKYLGKSIAYLTARKQNPVCYTNEYTRTGNK